MSVDNRDQLSFSGGGLNGIQEQANGSGSDQPNAGGSHAQAANTRIAHGSPGGGGQNAAPSPSNPARWFGNVLAAVLGKLLP